jgi:SynChlorMet cassette protein ScmC
MSDSSSPWPEYSLTLADGSCWLISGRDEPAAEVVARFSKVMGLKPGGTVGQRIGVSFSISPTAGLFFNGDICALYANMPIDTTLYIHFIMLACFIIYRAQKNGAILLHGALAKREKHGVILTAPSGTGKTTASMRLLPPWVSLSDDATLVVRDSNGVYWAHPWPTWSRFQDGSPDDTWDVQQAVPLNAIFFLQRAAQERTEPVGAGQATGLLAQAVEQTNGPFIFRLDPIQARILRQELFETSCSLVQHVPVHFLHFTRTGPFWLEIEKALD